MSSVVDSAAKKVWQFSCGGWKDAPLEGTFVASQDEIDWILGSYINFGAFGGRKSELVIPMGAHHFTLVNDDAEFAKQFATTVRTIGTNPFKMLDADTLIEHDSKFGEGSVNGELVVVEPRREEFVDEGTRVITYDITDDIMSDDTANSREQESMDKFLAQFEVVSPERNSIHLSQHIERYSNGDIHCMKVIKRKSDGKCFGYPFSIGDDEYCISNGDEYGLNEEKGRYYAYVWLPVEPFVITGYKLSKK